MGGGTLKGDQPEVCDRCGGKAFRPATRRDRFTGWFTMGAGGGRPGWRCRTCGVRWSAGSGVAVLYRVSGGRWGARLPLDVLQVLRGARRWQPVPRFYAIVGAVALVPALAVAVVTAVSWWVPVTGVPAAAMVGAFLWSLGSAGGRGRRDVLRRVAPDRAWRQDLEEELAGLREQIGVFRLFKPEGWAGALSLEAGSCSIPRRGPRVLHEVTVVADQGDPLFDPDRDAPGWRPATPRVEIRCFRDTFPDPEEVTLSEFVGRAFPPSRPVLDDLEGGDRQEAERRMFAALRAHQQERHSREAEWAGRWQDGSVLVDGVAVPARLLTSDDAGVGVAAFVLGSQSVVVVAEGTALGSLTLLGVADPTPLLGELEARRRLMFARGR